MVTGIFFVILFESIIYGAINTSMFIDGEAHIRVNSGIRIVDLKVVEQVGGAYEVYNSDYSKDSTSLQVILPNSESVMVYEVTIVNSMAVDYEITEIIEDTYSNNSINYEIIDLSEGSVISNDASYTFKIRLTSKGDDLSNKCVLILRYLFKEIKEHEWNFDYMGKEQQFIVPYNGVYKLEVWGAQGGYYNELYIGGYGGYSVGTVVLDNNSILYINVGGQGTSAVGTSVICNGGYNGGGGARSFSYAGALQTCGGGGGATHVSFKSGLLSTLSGSIDNILIVAGGGGGGAFTNSMNFGTGGHGGGYKGSRALSSASDSIKNGLGSGGSQDSGGCRNGIRGDRCGSFGLGYSNSADIGSTANSGGGGGGFYGGGGTYVNASGGGSGYIGNTLLSSKSMYCYNCDESSDESIKTISTTNVSEVPISNYAKKGNGYVKITFIK